MIRERNGRLEVIVYAGIDAAGKKRRVSRTVRGTGRDARREAKRIEGELLERVREHRPSGATFDELLNRWTDAARRERSTRQRDDSYLRVHIRPALGALRVDKITTRVLNDFYLALEKERGLAASTVVRIHGIVAAALEHAVTEQYIAKNPARLASLPEVAPADPKSPTLAVVLDLLELAVTRHPDLACFIRVDAATGMRRGEICALRRSNLDLEDRVIRKTHAIGEGLGGSYQKATKNKARHPIAIDTGTAVVIAAQIARIDDRAAKLDTKLIDDPYLFTWEIDGSRPWTPSSVTRTFSRLRDLVQGADGVELRTLRQFVATWLLDQGVSLPTVARRLGHARTSTTADFYAAFLPPADRDAADQLGRALDHRELEAAQPSEDDC